MLSPHTTRQLIALHHNQHKYRPGREVAAQLQDKTLLMFVGPSAGGKNTVIDAVAAIDSHFGPAGNQTSREPRDSDNPNCYTYLAHTDIGLQPLFGAIDKRQLVQYAVSFFEPHYVYATTATDYPHNYCLKDVFFDATSQFHTLPFKRIIAINLITPPEVWLPRFNDRFPFGHPDRTGRIAHACKSLEWSLDQPDSPTHVWIENGADLSQTVTQIIRVAGDGHQPNSAPLRAMAYTTLQTLQEKARP